MINALAMALLLTTIATPGALAAGTNRCANSPLAGARQLVLVIASDWNSKDAHIARFSGSPAGGWTGVDPAPLECVIGRSGMGWGLGVYPTAATPSRTGDPEKHEGDGRAPAGVFPLGDGFGYHSAAEVGFPPPGPHERYHQVDANSKCIDDPKSRFYNLDVYDESRVTQDWYPDGKDKPEDLHRSDDLYEYAVNVGHNGLADASRPHGQPVPGRGSCIFLHSWRSATTDANGVASRPGTAGCTAMAKDDIHRMLQWLRPTDRPLLVQLPASEYRRLKASWCLPDVDLGKFTAAPGASSSDSGSASSYHSAPGAGAPVRSIR